MEWKLIGGLTMVEGVLHILILHLCIATLFNSLNAVCGCALWAGADHYHNAYCDQP